MEMEILSFEAPMVPKEFYFKCGEFRYQVFCERLGWELETTNGLEFDEFDGPDTLYIVARDETNKICGHTRLLPTHKPYFIGTKYPQLLNGMTPPCSKDIWELSRFAIDPESSSKLYDKTSQSLSSLLLNKAIEVLKEQNASHLISASPIAVERMLLKLGKKVQRAGPPVMIGKRPVIGCWIDIS